MFSWFHWKEKDNQDVLELKQRELASFSLQYDSAISLVTSTIDNLKTLGESISRTITEIDEYQSELANTKDGLWRMKEKNDKVAANFSALLGE
jgi:prefoldin subunit 5